MTTIAKVEKVSKLPFAGTQAEIKAHGLSKTGRIVNPKQFEAKAIAHLRQVDTNIARLIEGTLATMPIPVALDPTLPTAIETRDIAVATTNNALVDESNAKLRQFLITSLEGVPFHTIMATSATGAEKTGLQSWKLLMDRYKVKEVSTLESELEKFRVDPFGDMESQ